MTTTLTPCLGSALLGLPRSLNVWFWGNLLNFPILAYISIQREYVMLVRTQVRVLLQLVDNCTIKLQLYKCWRLSTWCSEVHNLKFSELSQKEYQGGRQHEPNKKVMSDVVKHGNHYIQNTLAQLTGWGRPLKPVQSLPAPMEWT